MDKVAYMDREVEDVAAQTDWRFGSFALQPFQRRLLRDGVPVDLEERVFDLIVLLVRHHDYALDRREITEALWGARPVSDNTLRQLVHKARRALGDDGEHQNFIRTLHGRSLQWVAPIEPVPVAANMPKVPAPPVAGLVAPRPDSMRRRRRVFAAAAAVVLGAIAVALWMPRAQVPANAKPLPRVAIEPFDNATGDASLDWIKSGLPGLIDSLLMQRGGLDVADVVVAAKAWSIKPQQGRNRELQLRFVTGADVLVGGVMNKLGGELYELKLHVDRGAGRTAADLDLTGEKPALLAVDAVERIRRALALDPSARPGQLPRDPFLAEAYARGKDLALQGKWVDAKEYFSLCAKGAPDFLPAALDLGLSQTMTNDLRGGELALRHLVAAAQTQNDLLSAGHALMWLAHLAVNRHESAETLKYVNKALPLSHQARDADAEIKLHAMAAIAAADTHQPDLAKRELRASRELSSSHPRLLIAKGVLLDAEAHLAGIGGDINGEIAITREALALREQLGDERDIVASLNNLGDVLRADLRFTEALDVGARAYKRARAGQYAELKFDTGFNLLSAMVFIGLDEQVIDGGDVVLEQAKRSRISEQYQMRTLQWVGIAKMDKGDAAGALSTLRVADAVVPLHELPFVFVATGQSYEAYAAFVAAPAEVGGIQARFDAYLDARKGQSGFKAWAFEKPMLQALSLAAARRPGDAEKALQSALQQAHDAGADPAPVRTTAMLIAATVDDAAIAAIGLKNFDATTEMDALRLRLIAEWGTRSRDAAMAAGATARLASLHKRGIDALIAAGLDPADPLGKASRTHAQSVATNVM
ncbi:MAG TPA: winged helix-turn-helix domain-containing protein [Rhodanobacteraceae bacterium]|nr:winged helix-turn-helix domain-containing protein [Rhodanobacteraceae bacterium]